MSAVAQQALALWGLNDRSCKLVAARENAVYRVEADAHPLALRLHRQAYRSDAELRSELNWMAAAARGGLRVPAPIASDTGAYLCRVEGVQVDMLTWLDGETLDQALENGSTDRTTKFYELGRQMARLHNVSDAWTAPHDFTRCAWDRDGLVGPDPLWGRFWENPALGSDDRALFTAFRERAHTALGALRLDYGLIHADLVPGNVMVDAGQLALIDFDDGGYGYRLFDVVTALLKLSSQPDFPALKDNLLRGYASVRDLDLAEFSLFMALRSVTYVGWNIARADETGAAARNTRFIDTARRFVRAYLGGEDPLLASFSAP